MQNRWLADEWFTNDDKFNSLYPPLIQKLADHHWTPLQVATDTADFLVPENGVKVLMSPRYHLAETRRYKLLNFWIKS